MTADVLGRRALNRATLSRQMLMVRDRRPVLDAVDHLVGLQAQEPPDPFVALWSRLEGFRPDDLGELLLDRRVVRLQVMRGTIHLVTAADAVTLRPLTQPVLDSQLRHHRDVHPAADGIDVEPVLRWAAAQLREAPVTPRRLRAALAEQFPDLDPAALALVCRHRLPVVQVPPRGLWGRSAGVTLALLDDYLGLPLDTAPSIDDVLVRYLAAFGPAGVADAAAWCRLTGLRPVFDRLRPRLRTFRDVSGRELFDLPDAVRPDPETPAPVRFLPEYDNLLLSHADRSRFSGDDAGRVLFSGERPVLGTVLRDGSVVGTWYFRLPDGKPTRRVGSAIGIQVHHVTGVAREVEEIEAEAAALASLLPGPDPTVQVTAVT